MQGRTIGGGVAGLIGPEDGGTVARVHSVETFGTVDGPGIRYVIFFQGCPLRCRYCHNRDTWERASGEERTIVDLAADIERYAPFLRPSGGGVTAGGGEPLLQASAISELFSLVHRMQLTTALDTSGHAAFNEPIERLLEHCDLVILDLKQMDDARHRDLTGVSNRLILNFARGVAERGVPLWLRHVVVPGCTTDPDDVAALGEFAASLRGVERLELLPYHEMGRHKWEAVGARYTLSGVAPPSQEQMQQIHRQLQRFDLPLVPLAGSPDAA